MIIRSTSGQLQEARADDDEEREELGVGEDVLDPRGPAHRAAVDRGQQADAGRRQQPHARGRGLALGEERLGGVQREGEGHDGLGAGPHDHALHPQPAHRGGPYITLQLRVNNDKKMTIDDKERLRV